MNMSENHSDIKPTKKYTISKLMEMGIFWWIKSRLMYMNILKEDKRVQDILKPKKIGVGNGARYTIEGKNIIKFFRVYGPGINLLKKYERSRNKSSSNQRAKTGSKG